MTVSETQPNRLSAVPRRLRTTSRRVILADKTARLLITLGGVGTIVAVLLVCVFLIWVVIPLFLPATMGAAHDWQAASASPPAAAVHVNVDEYLSLVWVGSADGTIEVYRADDGGLLGRRRLFADQSPCAWSYALSDGHLCFAFDDGTIRLGTVTFATSFVSQDEIPAAIKSLRAGEAAPFQDGLVQRTAEGQFRLQQLRIELQEPVRIDTDSPILLIDQSVSSRGKAVAVLTADGQLRLAQVTERKNLLTGKITPRLREGKLPVVFPRGAKPTRLMLAGLGDSLLLAWEDGYVQRFDTRDITRPVLAEKLDLVPEPGARLTSLAYLVGKSSLVSGDSLGRVGVWFRTKPEDAATSDGSVLVRSHSLPGGGSDVRGLAASPRSRLVAAAFADGRIRLYHVTSDRQLGEVRAETRAGPLETLALSPQDDALLGWSPQGLQMWEIHAPHPEITWASIFRPVWYEGANRPEHVWQSSSGTDDFEEKYGLAPLVFGTLKATFYSMLFGAPLALLAAIYSSEFLTPRSKSRVKPTIEVMASLPSVVLGFLAALVFAPLVEGMVPQVLTGLFTVPFAYLLGAYLWQLLPSRLAVRARRLRMLGMALSLPLGVYLAALLGSPVERWLFAGDVLAWLDGQRGTGTGAWMFLLLPLSVLIVSWLSSTQLTPALRRWAGGWDHTPFAMLDLGKFLALCGATLLLAFAVSSLLNLTGWDPRGTFVGTYVQRNALVVGFIMGFAIIPIIFTLSEDALSAVPESLRAASLGAGATPWQTAVRVVIPTAMSGLFSAMMIGLGRAVGETMVVLMAAGNTPLMDLNIFNGFRTLSANIAVEMSEAVVNSTHYRMLFLAALTLFVMTFVVNTVAELVRLRFRRKAFQL